MAGALPEHNLLTPDYWQDSVSYAGKTGTGKPASSGNRSGDWREQVDRRIASSCQGQRLLGCLFSERKNSQRYVLCQNQNGI